MMQIYKKKKGEKKIKPFYNIKVLNFSTSQVANIPLSSAHGVYIFQLMLQGYNESCLKLSFRKFYGQYNDFLWEYRLSLAHMLNDLFHALC
jgi:hypothetical protein